MSFDNKVISEIHSSIGEEISSIVMDGEIHRFGKDKRAWYRGTTWLYEGKEFGQVSFGSWKTGDKFKVKSWDEKQEQDAEFVKRQKEYNDRLQEKLKQETLDRYKACEAKWKPIYDSASTNDIHGYLISKGIYKANCTRIDDKGELLIPAYNINGFVGVQRIFFDGKEGAYKKKFAYGTNKRGAICTLMPFIGKQLCYLAEGYATAASIQDCFPTIPVICAFDAGNIIPSIETIRIANPNIHIIIASDFDRESLTGQTYAKKACDKFKDVEYRLPIFKNESNLLTDFNDLMVTEGKEAVIRILK